jgi:hypothetical protein
MHFNYTADSLFLEPPHSHDPSNVSHVAALPADMLSQLPESVQNALWMLQESTSIVYASYLRLQALLEERFDRLTPLPGMPGSCKAFSLHFTFASYTYFYFSFPVCLLVSGIPRKPPNQHPPTKLELGESSLSQL